MVGLQAAPRVGSGIPASWVAKTLGALLALHGIAHFVGIAPTLQSIDEHERVELLFGAWETTEPNVLRVLAVGWGAVGAAFLVAAVVVGMRSAHARATFVAVTAASLAFCVLTLPIAFVGVVFNLMLLPIAFVCGALFRSAKRGPSAS